MADTRKDLKSKKISSYQRMKAKYESQIDDLNKDIKLLVEGSYIEKEETKLKYSMKYSFEAAINMQIKSMIQC